MYAVLLVAVYVTVDSHTHAGPWSLAPILPFALFCAIVALCVKLHFSQWIAVDAENVRINPEAAGIPQEVSENYRNAVAGLTPRGFKPVLSYKTKPTPNGIGFSTVFKNDRTSEVAMTVNSFASTGRGTIKTSLLVFRTEFADGTNVTTSNNKLPSYVPPPRPPDYVFAFPQVLEPGRLYEVHQAVVGQFAEGSPRRDPIGDDPDAYLELLQQRLHAHFLECGYHYLDEAKGILRLTWKGAFMASLKLIWPTPQIRKIWRRWKAARMLQELNLT
jgi:hypothetical protein